MYCMKHRQNYTFRCEDCVAESSPELERADQQASFADADLKNVTTIGGNWNQNNTPAERFEELALMARKDPDKFKDVLVIWSSHKTAKDKEPFDYTFVGCNASWEGIMGLLEMGKAYMIGRWTGWFK